MKRRLTKLVVFLVLGAIVNVAVAWGLVVRETSSFYNRPFQKYIIFHEDGRCHFAGTYSGFARTTIRYYDKGEMTLAQVERYRRRLESSPGQRDYIQRELDLPSWSFAARVQRGDDSTDLTEALDHVAGWPVRSLRCQMLYQPSAGSVLGERPFVRYGLLLPQRQNDGWPESRALPVYPIWPGCAINTVFYAAILWFLTLGPFTVRRLIRHKRGHCIKCGYDLRGAEHEVCPECGVETV